MVQFAPAALLLTHGGKTTAILSTSTRNINDDGTNNGHKCYNDNYDCNCSYSLKFSFSLPLIVQFYFVAGVLGVCSNDGNNCVVRNMF